MTTEASAPGAGPHVASPYATNVYVGVRRRGRGLPDRGGDPSRRARHRRHLLGGAAARRARVVVRARCDVDAGRVEPVVHQHRPARRHGPRRPRRRRHRRHDHRAASSRAAPRCAPASSTRACSRPWAWSAGAPTSRPAALRGDAARRVPGRSCGTSASPSSSPTSCSSSSTSCSSPSSSGSPPGVPMRTQVGRLLGSAGPAHLGYGIIAFIMVVLWEPAGLGSASVVPHPRPRSLVAQWAYRAVRRGDQGPRAGPRTCSSPRSRPRRRTWPATAPASPS